LDNIIRASHDCTSSKAKTMLDVSKPLITLNN
jgi:hypothetical protein